MTTAEQFDSLMSPQMNEEFRGIIEANIKQDIAKQIA